MIPSSKPLMRWAFPLSLAVNVFLLAVIGVHEFHRPHGPPNPEHFINHLASVLPKADAVILRQVFATEPLLHWEPHGPGGDDMEPVRQALRAYPFDPTALRVAFETGHAQRDTRDQAVGRVLVTVATAISAEGRRRLADLRGPPGPPPP